VIHVVNDPEKVAAAGARLVNTMLCGRAKQTSSNLSLVLSGGTTPRRLYNLLANGPGEKIPWGRVGIFWGDERCVALDDVRSNYAMVARTGLLDRPLGGVHRMPGELPPEQGAETYESEIRALYPDQALPRFDLILLGLGNDGHIASLFEESPGLTDRKHWVIVSEPYEGTRRLTLTLPVLAAARSLIFLVSGEAKAEAVRQVLAEEKPSDDRMSPAERLLQMIAINEMAGWDSPSLSWVLDKSAALLLDQRRLRLDGGAAPR
jgi:6-phosphogluconolactonase